MRATHPSDADARLLRWWFARPEVAPDDSDEDWGAVRTRRAIAATREKGAYGSNRQDRPKGDDGPSEPVELEPPAHLSRPNGKPRAIYLRKAGNARGRQSESRAEFAARFGSERVHSEPRPATRADCVDGPRPCPFVSCRHNLYLDVSFAGSIRLTHPELDPDEVHPDYSCALDVAARGRHTCAGVGRILGVTRERVRQLQESGLGALALALGRKPWSGA